MIKIIKTGDRYFEGGAKIKFKKEFDYLLFRQDIDGSESVYFNRRDIKKIFKLIASEVILIHTNYSILYSKNRRFLNFLPELECYRAVAHV